MVFGKSDFAESDLEDKIKKLKEVLREVEEYLSARVEFPPKGTIGRTVILPRVREALKL